MVHDHWFNVSAVGIDLRRGVVRVSFGPFAQRLGGFVSGHRLDAPTVMRTLTIRDVSRCALADTQGIDTYTLSRLDHDPSTGLLRIVTCEPTVFDVETTTLDVTVD